MEDGQGGADEFDEEGGEGENQRGAADTSDARVPECAVPRFEWVSRVGVSQGGRVRRGFFIWVFVLEGVVVNSRSLVTV